jgi:transposase
MKVAPLADMLNTVQAGTILLAGRAYDSDACGRPCMSATRGPTSSPSRGGRGRCPSAAVYRWPNLVERFFNKIKHFRAIATRHDKRDGKFVAGIKLADVRIWLRSYESATSTP